MKTLLIIIFIFLPLYTRAEALTINLFYNMTTQTLSFVGEGVELNSNISLTPSQSREPENFSQYDVIVHVYDHDTKIFSKGAYLNQENILITIPYFSLGTKLKIENTKNKTILEKDINFLSRCDGDTICEYSKGETESTCLGDCASTKVRYDRTTRALLKENKGIITDSSGKIVITDRSDNTSFPWVPVFGILFISSGIIYVYWRKKHY